MEIADQIFKTREEAEQYALVKIRLTQGDSHAILKRHAGGYIARTVFKTERPATEQIVGYVSRDGAVIKYPWHGEPK